MVLVYVWINVLSATDEIYLKQYQLGCYAVAVSCIVDQVTQPVLLVAQSFCFIKLKVGTMHVNRFIKLIVIIVLGNVRNILYCDKNVHLRSFSN